MAGSLVLCRHYVPLDEDLVCMLRGVGHGGGTTRDAALASGGFAGQEEVAQADAEGGGVLVQAAVPAGEFGEGEVEVLGEGRAVRLRGRFVRLSPPLSAPSPAWFWCLKRTV